MTTHPLIEFRDVTVTNGDRSILEGISFTVNAGEKVVLTGPSGAGKSSVLHVLLGFLPVTRGTVFFDGEPLSVQTVFRLRRTAATVLQEPVPSGQTVKDTLLFPFSFRYNRHAIPDHKSIAAVLRSLGLSRSILEQPVGNISGGEKQRIALARSFLLGRNLLLLDEITSALDEASKKKVFAAIRQHNATILSAGHDPDWIAQCDRAVRLAGGSIVDTPHHPATGDHHDND